MGEQDLISIVRQALKMSNDIEDSIKLEGLSLLSSVLVQQDTTLSDYGYIDVIFKELNKLARFESGELYVKITDLLLNFYSKDIKYQDDLMETLIYRYGLSNGGDVGSECLKKISSLIDCMDDNVAKHSKKILQLVDLGGVNSTRPIIVEILEKMREKVPIRKRII